MVAIAPISSPPAPTTAGRPDAPASAPLPGPALTTPTAFLLALTSSNFDLPATAAATPPDLLLQFAQDPALLAQLRAMTTLANLCQELRQAHFRSIAMTALGGVIKIAEDPTELRRAATALLRSTKPAAAAHAASPARDTEPHSPKPASEQLRSPESNGPHPRDPESSAQQPPAPPATAPEPSANLPSPQELKRERKPTPRHTSRPSRGLTAELVVEKLLEAIQHPDTPKENAGLATIAAFCDDDAELNGEPLPTDDPADCIEVLAATQIPSLHKGDKPVTVTPLTISEDTATCTTAWTPSPAAAPITLTLNFKRLAFSRCPDEWLISSLDITPAPD